MRLSVTVHDGTPFHEEQSVLQSDHSRGLQRLLVRSGREPTPSSYVSKRSWNVTISVIEANLHSSRVSCVVSHLRLFEGSEDGIGLCPGPGGGLRCSEAVKDAVRLRRHHRQNPQPSPDRAANEVREGEGLVSEESRSHNHNTSSMNNGTDRESRRRTTFLEIRSTYFFSFQSEVGGGLVHSHDVKKETPSSPRDFSPLIVYIYC